MATIEFQCSDCGAVLETESEHGGDRSPCPQCGKTVLIPLAGITPGSQIGGYVVERRLGTGGMGEVWLATQTAMSRKVALKILAPALAKDQSFIDRFMEEVKTSAKLEHPNIVTAYDAGRDKDVYYLAMTFVDGSDLSDRLLLQGKLPEAEALRVFRNIAVALQFAWERNRILHRDIKPSNIMTGSDGSVKLLDMGISKSITENSALTLSGVIMGTPHYMSPELARAEGEIDCRADIYGLGATLYHVVTGQVPYDGTTAIGILTRHITDPFPSPRERNPELSEACSVLLETMMAKSPEDRQHDWDAVIRDIDLVMGGEFPATSRPKIGKSQVMRMKKGEALAQRLVAKHLVKARRVGAPSVSAQKSSSAKSKTPIIIAAIAASILLAFTVAALLSRKSSMQRAPPAVAIDAPAPDESLPAPTLEPVIGMASDQPVADPLEDAWEQANRLVVAQPQDIEGAIAAYEAILRRAAGTRYEQMAQAELGTWRNRQIARVQETAAEPDPAPLAQPVVAEAPEGSLTEPAVDPEPVRPEVTVPELARAKTIYQAQIDTIKQETGKQREELHKHFLEALRRLEQVFRDRGELNHVLLVRNEIERFTQNPDAEIEDVAVLPERMQTLWNALATSRKRYADDEEARIRDLSQRYVRHLYAITPDLTRQDRIEDALAVETEIAAVLMSPSLIPTLKIVVEAGGRNVAAVIEQTEGPEAARVDDNTYRLTADANYAFSVSYTEDRGDRIWHPATLTLASDWRGVRTSRIVLQQWPDPSDGRDWTSPATGMEFVWIPAMRMWVGKFEVTNGEYRKKEPNHNSRDFSGHSLNGDRQPVVYVNFDDAKAYAEWLTQQDRTVLGGARYRLPSEQEWMTYAQCGDGREFPWGNNWPPLSGQAGNYTGEESLPRFTHKISGYDDGFPVSAPVDRLWKNPWGLYGVGGNVWESCAEDSSGGSFGAWRGASWSSNHQSHLRCSYRYDVIGSYRSYNFGFRLVLSR